MKLFASYLRERTFSVQTGNYPSSPAPKKCGIHQGLILEHLLYSFNMLPFGSVLQNKNTLCHCYTDDTQFYLPVTPARACSPKNLFNCLDDIKCWMAKSFFKLNENKTKVIIFGPLNSVTSLS